MCALLTVAACGGPSEHPSPDACADGATAPPLGCEVAIAQGVLHGQYIDGVFSYRGISYAEPPVGERRFRPPAPPPAWTGVHEATAFGAACPQVPPGSSTPIGDEDCLTVNIWTPDPQPAAALPVLFFIHGGAHRWGSAAEEGFGRPWYDGHELADRGPAVVVTIQYRLGTLGFLAHAGLRAESANASSGNYGVLDLIAGLRWVQDNIAAFGGDPAKVLVFGQSAGGYLTCDLIASPLARGLFSRAMPLSGCGFGFSAAISEQAGLDVAAAAGCADPASAASCLRELPAEQLAGLLEQRLAPSASIDGWVLPDSPTAMFRRGEHNRMPVLLTNTADEYRTLQGSYAPGTGPVETDAEYRAALATYFTPIAGPIVYGVYPSSAYPSPNDALIAAMSDFEYACFARRAARGLAAHGDPVYRAIFAYAFEDGPYAGSGSGHGLDLIFGFGRDELGSYELTDDERELADAMIGYWTRFASTGDPNGDAAAPFDRYDGSIDNYVTLDAPIGAGSRWHGDQCDFWDVGYGIAGY